jgi:hypothetical protein
VQPHSELVGRMIEVVRSHRLSAQDNPDCG